MPIDVKNISGVSTVRPEGDLTGGDGGAFVDTVKRLLDRGSARVIIDLGAVDLISSAGLGDLVHLNAQANTQGGRLLMARPQPFVSGVFDTTKLNRFFEVFDDLEAALAELRS